MGGRLEWGEEVKLEMSKTWFLFNRASECSYHTILDCSKNAENAGLKECQTLPGGGGKLYTKVTLNRKV